MAITMDGSGVIAVDGGSSDGQQRHNGWRDIKGITMGNEMAVIQWMAQWAADNGQWMRGQRWEQCLVFHPVDEL